MSPVERDDPSGSFRFVWIYVFTGASEKGNLKPIHPMSAEMALHRSWWAPVTATH